MTSIPVKSTTRSTEFVFKATQKGEYTLLFQKQDNTRGVTNEQKIHVSVVDEARFEELINSFDGTFTGSISPEDEEKSYDTAEYHYREGREAEALEEYMKNYRPGDPQIDHRIATLSYNQGKWEQARSFWQKNSDEEGSYGSLALDGLVRTAVQLKDSGLLNTVLPRLMEK